MEMSTAPVSPVGTPPAARETEASAPLSDVARLYVGQLRPGLKDGALLARFAAIDGVEASNAVVCGVRGGVNEYAFGYVDVRSDGTLPLPKVEQQLEAMEADEEKRDQSSIQAESTGGAQEIEDAPASEDKTAPNE